MNKNDLFERRCINKYLAMNIVTHKPMLYKREDLWEWEKEACEKGEKYFYCSPVDPNNPYGELKLCEPKYRYFTKKDGLTEEQFKSLSI